MTTTKGSHLSRLVPYSTESTIINQPPLLGSGTTARARAPGARDAMAMALRFGVLANMEITPPTVLQVLA